MASYVYLVKAIAYFVIENLSSALELLTTGFEIVTITHGPNRCLAPTLLSGHATGPASYRLILGPETEIIGLTKLSPGCIPRFWLARISGLDWHTT